MISITNILKEAKQVGILYHFTSDYGMKGILKSNILKASEEVYTRKLLYFVSFTRNKNFHKRKNLYNVKADYRITIDGNKLSEKYKIQPWAYQPSWTSDTDNFEWLDDEGDNTKRDFFYCYGGV